MAERSVMSEVLSATKLALTVVSVVSVSVQGSIPEQPPPFHPAKVEPWTAAAVNVTCVPTAKPASQIGPHTMPEGLLVAVPAPVPIDTIDSKAVIGSSTKLAVTVVSASSVS